MENKFGLKIFLSIIIALALFITFGWLLLYSSTTANNSFIIKVRNFYYLRLLPVWGFDQRDLTYTIFPSQKDTKYGYYTYTLLGKFEKFDFNNYLIYLTGKNGQTYAVKYLIKRLESDTKLVYFEYQDFYNQNIPLKDSVVIDVFKKEETITKFVTGDVIEIQWESFETLDQILAKKSDNEVLIENEGVLKNVTQVINRYLYEN